MKLCVRVGFLIILALICKGEKEEKNDRQKRLIIAKYRTWTNVLVTTTTVLRPYTCQLASANTISCKKRRRKRALKLFQAESENYLNEELNPSWKIPLENIDKKSTSNRVGRLKIIFWSTVISQYTITSTSINSATSFSISFFCSDGGASYPPMCG